MNQNKLLLNIATSFVVFANAVDAALTVWTVIIIKTHIEANPLMDLLISNSVFGFILVKIFSMPLLIQFLQYYSNSFKLARICIYVSAILYLILMCWWIYMLF